MKQLIKIGLIFGLVASLCAACYQAPNYQGYLGDGIYLQGADTLVFTIGTKGQSSTAWLDNSTKPCTFEIINVRDANNKRVEGFFKGEPTALWKAPYDFLTDKTVEAVMAKIDATPLTPMIINAVNGQIMVLESTKNVGIEAGDVFNVDVRVTNSRGSVDIKDYAIVKFEAGSKESEVLITDFINGICVVNAAGENTFPYYDQINSTQTNFSERVNNILADNGKEKNFVIRKISNEPEVGIKVHIKFLDKNGKLFDPATYTNYSTTYSMMDHGLNRVNDPEKGLILEFPLTPWPVDKTHLYMSGPRFDFPENLDMAQLKADNLAKKIPFNAGWPEDDYAGSKGWFVRLRTNLQFYEAGTWEISVKVPYVTVN